MFWRKKRQVESSVAVLEEQVRPKWTKIVRLEPHPKGEVEEYAALCQTVLGEIPNAAKMLLLRQFLAERGLPVYDSRLVHEYLMQKAKDEQGSEPGERAVYWQPLRKKDRLKSFAWWWGYDHKYGRRCEISREVYNKLVPSSALETVKVISSEFPDAKFFVSNIREVLDPFLLVTYPLVEPAVVDFWDEPGFKPKT